MLDDYFSNGHDLDPAVDEQKGGPASFNCSFRYGNNSFVYNELQRTWRWAAFLQLDVWIKIKLSHFEYKRCFTYALIEYMIDGNNFRCGNRFAKSKP